MDRGHLSHAHSMKVRGVVYVGPVLRGQKCSLPASSSLRHIHKPMCCCWCCCCWLCSAGGPEAGGGDGAGVGVGLASLLAEREAELENLQAALGELSYEVGGHQWLCVCYHVWLPLGIICNACGSMVEDVWAGGGKGCMGMGASQQSSLLAPRHPLLQRGMCAWPAAGGRQAQARHFTGCDLDH